MLRVTMSPVEDPNIFLILFIILQIRQSAWYYGPPSFSFSQSEFNYPMMEVVNFRRRRVHVELLYMEKDGFEISRRYFFGREVPQEKEPEH